MNLSTPSNDLKEIKKQNDLFKKLKADHEKQLKELTKGQDIAKLEASAKKIVEDANEKASGIIAKARTDIEDVSKSKIILESLKSDLEQSKKDIDAAKQSAMKAKQEAEKVQAEVENLKSERKVLF